jgi:hypothetical protein
MIFVPLNKKCFARLGWTDEAARFRSFSDSSVIGTFDTGTDSPIEILDTAFGLSGQWRYLPVSMLSFTMQSPDNRRLSHGNRVREGSETS